MKNEKTQRLHDFKAAVAEALCKYDKPLEHTTGSVQKRSRRDDSTTNPNPAKHARRSAAHQVPSSDVRLDKTGHFRSGARDARDADVLDVDNYPVYRAGNVQSASAIA